MKTVSQILFVLIILTAIFSCEKDCKTVEEQAEIKSISGKIEKGPFAQGSQITLFELDDDLIQTGRSFSTFTKNNIGEFEIEGIDFENTFVEIIANGYFFNEVTGSLSESPITLSAISDISDISTLNVNIVSHLIRPALKNKIKKGYNYSEAVSELIEVLLSSFYISEQINPSEVSITDGTSNAEILTAISTLLLVDPYNNFNNLSEAELTEMLTSISEDLSDGSLDDENTKNRIEKYSDIPYHIITSVHKNLIEKYGDEGLTINSINFQNYIDFDEDFIIDEDDVTDIENSYNISISNNEYDRLYTVFDSHLNDVQGNVAMLFPKYHCKHDATTVELLNANEGKSHSGDVTFYEDGSCSTSFEGKIKFQYGKFFVYVNDEYILPERMYSKLVLNKGDRLTVKTNPLFFVRTENHFNHDEALSWIEENKGSILSTSFLIGGVEKSFSIQY